MQTLECDDCGVGFYQNQSSQMSCYRCPSGLTTETATSTDIAQCQNTNILGKYCLNAFTDGKACSIIHFICVMFFISVSCEPGTFRNIQTVICDDCGIGFYQNQSNHLFCYSCPSGFTTITTTATGKDQCLGIVAN